MVSQRGSYYTLLKFVWGAVDLPQPQRAVGCHRKTPSMYETDYLLGAARLESRV